MGSPKGQPVDPRVVGRVVRRARAVTAALGQAGPPFALERAAARLGITKILRVDAPGAACRILEGDEGAPIIAVDRGLPPHTPEWNGCVAMTLARLLLPPAASGAGADELVEIAAAELLLPARAFRPIAGRTDLTMDGLRDLAHRFSAPIRLTVRQWLLTGTWVGFALLWREEASGVRLRWRAASPGTRYPPCLALGARAEAVWRDTARLCATLRTGRPHHGVEEVQAHAGAAWWFARFGLVREDGGRAVLALVVLDRRARDAGRAGRRESFPDLRISGAS